MAEVMHFGALLSAGVGLQCTVGARRDDALRWISAAIMLLAMIDITFGFGMLAPVAWVGVMLATAVWLAIRARVSQDDDRAAHHERTMWLHHACALVVTAGLTAVMGVALPRSGAGHHLAAGGMLLGLVLLGSLAFLGFTVWLVVRVQRPKGAVLPKIEASSMGAMVGAMALAAVL